MSVTQYKMSSLKDKIEDKTKTKEVVKVAEKKVKKKK